MVRMRKGIVGFDAISCHESNDLVKVRPFKYLFSSQVNCGIKKNLQVENLKPMS